MSAAAGSRRLPVPPIVSYLRAITLFASLLACAPVRGDAGDDSPLLEEIAVTARKLEERLSRVPASVFVLPGSFIDEATPSSLHDLQLGVPGLVVSNRGAFGGGIALRGVTDVGGGTVSVAPHIDGIYLGRPAVAMTRLFDVAHVEILKGPQGTLYGRNAIGGTVNVTTRKPGESLAADLVAAMGSFDTIRFQGTADLPAERYAVRVAVAGSDSRGFIRNSVDNRRFAEDDYVGLRASLRMRPLGALTFDLSAQHVIDDGGTGELWLPRKDFLADPNDVHLATVTLADPHLERRDDLIVADAAYEFDGLQLRSLTGYVRNRTDNRDDCGGLPFLRGCVRGVQPLTYEQVSQELRLSPTDADSVDWIAGLYYVGGRESMRFFTALPPSAGIAPTDEYRTTDESAYAIFAEASKNLGRQWVLLIGIRASYESQREEYLDFTAPAGTQPILNNGSWRQPSWKLGLQYDMSDRLMLYVTGSSGFKSGGVTTVPLADGAYDGYGPETLLSLEAGLKLSLPWRHWGLHASVFDYDYDDMQVQTTAVIDGGIATVIDNAGKAKIQGVDIWTSIDLAEALTLAGGVVWLPRREFVDFRTASIGGDLTGNTLIRAPEWSTTASLAYRRNIGRYGAASLRAEYDYRSRVFFTAQNREVESQGAFGLVNLYLRFDHHSGRWYLFGSARNLFDADYFTQVFLQSSPGEPRSAELGIGLSF